MLRERLSSLYRIALANLAGRTARTRCCELTPSEPLRTLQRPRNRGLTSAGNRDNETHLPAKQSQKKAVTRLSRPHGDKSRPAGVETSAGERPRSPHALIGADSPRLPGSTRDTAGGRRLPRDARLSDSADFSRVFRRSVRSTDSYFTVLAHFQSLGAPRLGVAVSRKTARSAVARNRIKRIIRESFRHGCETLGSADIVVISRPPAAAASNSTLNESLEGHWRRLCSRRPKTGTTQGRRPPPRGRT